MISTRQRLVWASLLAGATFAASAQLPAPATATAPADKPRAEQRHGDPAQRFERMRAHRAERLAALKQKLNLTPAQEGAWRSFSSASAPPAAPPQRMDRAEFAKLTTPQRLDRMQARQTERAARFASRAAATRSFYAELTPAQQTVFDAESLHLRHGEGRGHRHERHRG